MFKIRLQILKKYKIKINRIIHMTSQRQTTDLGDSIRIVNYSNNKRYKYKILTIIILNNMKMDIVVIYLTCHQACNKRIRVNLLIKL